MVPLPLEFCVGGGASSPCGHLMMALPARFGIASASLGVAGILRAIGRHVVDCARARSEQAGIELIGEILQVAERVLQAAAEIAANCVDSCSIGRSRITTTARRHRAAQHSQHRRQEARLIPRLFSCVSRLLPSPCMFVSLVSSRSVPVGKIARLSRPPAITPAAEPTGARSVDRAHALAVARRVSC